MTKGAVAIIVCVLIGGTLYAECKTDACRQAVAWKNGYTAVVLDDNISRADYMAVLDLVKANEGIVAIEAERVLLGWVPVATAAKVRGARGVSALSYQAIARPADLVHRAEALAALSFFNRVTTGEFEDAIETGLAAKGQPLTGCVIAKPDSGQRRPQGLSSNSQRTLPGNISPHWGWIQTPYRNTQMRGRITVQLFRLDSDGTVDPNLYTWSDADLSFSQDQVYGAFNFWVNQATARGITLSFTIRTLDPRYKCCGFLPTPTQYEPITRSSGDDYLWINDALARSGYGASPVTPDNVYTKNEAFNQAYAAEPFYGPFDGSFSVFVVYNPGSAPSTFANDSRAYTRFLGGPFTTVMWNSGGWQPQNLGLVLTHETGHIFWSCDEYFDSEDGTGCVTCYYCSYNVGPRNQVQTPWVTNANCDNPTSTGTCDVPRTSCIMRDQTLTLCPHTPGQIGW